MSSYVLSKSKLMRGLQCEKSLWLTCFQPTLETKPDMATQLQFNEGNEVGELARKLAGSGIQIRNTGFDYEKAHQETQKVINQHALIFEAAFMHQDLFARVDILYKDQKGWHLIEVKKFSSVKKHHYLDSAIQTFIIESTGFKLQSISVRYIDNTITYPYLEKIFLTENITEQVRELISEEFKQKILNLKKLLVENQAPAVSIGPHCDTPFECPFKKYCWQDKEDKSIFYLPNLFAKQKWQLYQSGKKSILQLEPKDFHGLTRRAIEVTKENKPYIDRQVIQKKIQEWKFPLYFFDFETIGPAIPRYLDSKPYDQIPFQFSCHVWKKKEDESLEHFEYLHVDTTDPRPEIIEAMLTGLKEVGSIIAYNKAFEMGVIKKLAKFDEKNKKKLLALNERFVDPLPLIKETVYHPEFQGRFSIKYVAPALIGKKLSYADLNIADGGVAQSVANQLLQGRITPEEFIKVKQSLLEYCRQDTLAMVELVKWLYRV